MLDCTQLTFGQMADIVRAIRDEVESRPERTLYLSRHWKSVCNQVVDALESIQFVLPFPNVKGMLRRIPPCSEQ
jgi:hypothetical protein